MRCRRARSRTPGQLGFGARSRTPGPTRVRGFKFPHHKLIAYQLALELVKLVARVRIGDANLRAQARKSASSDALNSAEGAARISSGDKSRCYAIAPAECCEACAAVEIAGALGVCGEAQVREVLALGLRLKNVLSRLVR